MQPLPNTQDLYAALRASGVPPENLTDLIAASGAEVAARLEPIDKGLLAAVLRAGQGRDAIEGASELAAWLKTVQAAPMLSPAPSRADTIVLRADGTAPQMPAYSDRAFDAWFAATGARYGLGPRGEKRSVYASAQFADTASPERRTIHMGIDVFAPALTKVYAPLAGTVHHLGYNADPLDYGHTLILRHDGPTGAFYTLYGHLAGTLPSLLQEGATVEAGQHIADFGDWHENGGWAPHLHFQIMSDMLAQKGNFFGVGHESLWDVWQAICPDPDLLMRLPEGIFARD